MKVRVVNQHVKNEIHFQCNSMIATLRDYPSNNNLKQLQEKKKT